MRAGASDYFRQPFPFDRIFSAGRDLAARNERASETGPAAADTTMIGQSAFLHDIKAYIGKVARSDSNVLITGETGTGKQLAAELIHRHSSRNRNPFVAINCAAIPDSLLESELFGYEKGAFTGAFAARDGKLKGAEGGTVFLDEIAEMSPLSQAKILRAMEVKEVQSLGARDSVALDVRIVAATNQDPESLVEERKFRKDLYFRLNVARIHLLPLRERRDDIPELAAHYISVFNRRFGREVEGFTDEALALLLHHDWPGNVRELKNLVEATFIALPSKVISRIDLPEPFQRHFHAAASMPQGERERLLGALYATNWNKSKAAQNLHWSRMTLYRKMMKHHIDPRGAADHSSSRTV
jgi:DNA-binding NtrC family response regulator